jgi:ribose 5-phosphate isomerase B
MKIGIGNDHVALEYKLRLKEYIEEKYDIEVIDYGTSSTKRFDYPISAQRVSQAVINHEVDRGILICGTGVGMSMVANKFAGVRAVLPNEEGSAYFARRDEDANCIVFAAGKADENYEVKLCKRKMIRILDVFIKTEFMGEERHRRRIGQMAQIEKAGKI